MSFELKPILKTLLLSTSEPLSIKAIQGLVQRYHEEAIAELESINEEASEVAPITDVPSMVTAAQVQEALDSINAELEEANDVFRIKEASSGFQLVTLPEYADWVRMLRNEPKPLKLSQSAMETLALIAYRQPITRPEMEAIRGVSVDHPITKLIEHDLVHVTGRAELPGRPMQYGTTSAFLDFCGIASLDELPASDVLSPGQLQAWINEATQPKEAVTDEDVGLPVAQSEEAEMCTQTADTE